MKVAIVSIRFDRKGGSERRTYQLTKGLIAAGHEVEIFAARVEDMDLPARVNIVPMSPGPSFFKVKSFAANVGRMLAARSDIEVVHSQIRPFTDGVVTVGGGCHAEYLEKAGGALSMLNPLHRVVLGMERAMYRPEGCRAVITNSKLAKAGILRHYPMPEEKVFVAYNGVDIEKFHPGRVQQARVGVRTALGMGEDPLVLFLGTGFARKGLQTVIRALPLVRTMKQSINRMRLVVVGKDAPGPFARLAKRLGVSDMITFAGPTAHPEDYYGAADIFVLPTKFDPFANAAIEAMACGLPVITTAQNGVSEIITDGENGYVMRTPDDYNGLAATLGYLSCAKARAEIGAEARRTAKGFTWEKTLARTVEVYKEIYSL